MEQKVGFSQNTATKYQNSISTKMH